VLFVAKILAYLVTLQMMRGSHYTYSNTKKIYFAWVDNLSLLPVYIVQIPLPTRGLISNLYC